MRILMITQKIDPADPLLAFTITWVRTLAVRVEHLYVLCLESKPIELPANVTVYSMGKDTGAGRIRELATFYRVVANVIRNVDAILCHMIPRYAVLVAPIAAIFRKSVALWYVHRQVTTELKLAMLLCRYILTAVPDGFPLQTAKLRAVGHGIDSTFFSPDPKCIPDNPPLIVQVARLSPIKRQDTLIQAMSELKNAQAVIVGAAPRGEENYESRLHGLVDQLQLTDRVHFAGSLLPDQVRDLYRRATLAVNLSPLGLFDKAALESMMVGTLTLVANPSFDGLLREHASRFRIESVTDGHELAHKINDLLQTPVEERRALALDIGGRTRTAHSIDGLMDRLVTLFATGR